MLNTSVTVDREAELLQLEQGSQSCKWLELEIVNTEAGTEADIHGVVEFVARYFENGEIRTMHERSRFAKPDGFWVYIDGDVQQADQATPQSLNGECYCGSGKKFKRCHGA